MVCADCCQLIVTCLNQSNGPLEDYTRFPLLLAFRCRYSVAAVNQSLQRSLDLSPARMQNANQTACGCCSCVGRWRNFLFDTVEMLVGSPLALVSFRPFTHLQVSNCNAGKYVCYIYFSGYCFWMTMLTRDRSWPLVLFMLTICPLSEYTIRNLYQMLS